VEDGKFGSVEDGVWNGMIGELVANKADVAINVISNVIERAKVVNFTASILHGAFAIVRLKTENIKIPSWDFITPLSLHLKIAIFVSFLIVLVVISVFENVAFAIGARRVWFSTQEVFTYLSGLAFQRDMGGTNPREWSGRLVALGYASAMTVVMSMYTARIAVSSIEDNSDIRKNLENKVREENY